MRAALAALPGVRHVDVDFENKQAVVTLAKGVDSQKLLAALEDAGFGGVVKDVRSVEGELDDTSEPDDAAEPPPPPGLSAEQYDPGSTNTTYSSASFAEHVQISAHLDRDMLRPGDTFRVGVVFDIDDGWHIYGNPLGPGIGQETTITADAPETLHIEPVRYAPAHRAEQDFGGAGKTWVWEHTGRAVHFLSGQVSDVAEPGVYRLTAEASAQVCTETACLPGTATAVLTVTVVPKGSPSQAINADLFFGFEKAKTPR
ncbi:MAG: cation transporter [Planctomycetia bacterium]|nr:cation transporter [Planctomycetia bacterium]